ncbi:hypothetical protein ACSTS3_06135 [Aquimarina muelleri]|uniref:hypothetical protein n=1 Tax=Aquimarina muelleri TaxID=279356 RepID=UPI003F68533C
MDLKKNLLQYSLNIASTIAELYYKNKSYHNVRCYLPEQGISITKDFKKEIPSYIRLSPDKPILVVIIASHKTLNYNGMKPEIKFEYIPETDRTYICTAYIIDEFNNIIDNSNIETSNPEDLGVNLYNLMIDTQDYFEQKLINS